MEIIWKIDLDTAADLEEVRIDDIKCNRIPTIEVLYQQQAPGGHFQFLCRVICSGILKPPICPDMTNVKDIMQQQTVVENWLPSAAEGTTTDDVAGGAIEQRPQVPEDGNTGNDIDNNIDETAQDSTTTGGDRDGIDIETTKAARSRLTTEDDVLDAVCAIIAHTEKRVYDSTLANAKKGRIAGRPRKREWNWGRIQRYSTKCAGMGKFLQHGCCLTQLQTNVIPTMWKISRLRVPASMCLSKEQKL